VYIVLRAGLGTVFGENPILHTVAFLFSSKKGIGSIVSSLLYGRCEICVSGGSSLIIALVYPTPFKSQRT
jgi:hypothetical protein